MPKMVEPDNDAVIADDTVKDCSVCDGSSICQTCSGNNEDCEDCEGSGDCAECDGSGTAE